MIAIIAWTCLYILHSQIQMKWKCLALYGRPLFAKTESWPRNKLKSFREFFKYFCAKYVIMINIQHFLLSVENQAWHLANITCRYLYFTVCRFECICFSCIQSHTSASICSTERSTTKSRVSDDLHARVELITDGLIHFSLLYTFRSRRERFWIPSPWVSRFYFTTQIFWVVCAAWMMSVNLSLLLFLTEIQ